MTALRPLWLIALTLVNAGLLLANPQESRQAVADAISAGELQQAELLLKDWETRDADNALISVFRAVILFNLGQRDYAMQRVQKLAQLEQPLEVSIQLATLFYDLNLHDTALKLLNDKQRQNLSAAQLHHLAGAYYAIAAANSAKKVWLRALEAKPKNGKILLGIISGLLSVGERQQSAPALKRVEVKDLDAPDLLFLGHQLVMQKFWPEAQRALQIAAILNPQQDNLWFLLGNTLMQFGRPSSAIAAYRREIDRNAYRLDVWLQLAKAHLASQQPQEAIATYASTLRILKAHYAGIRLQDNPDHQSYLAQQLDQYAQIADAQVVLYLQQQEPSMALHHWSLSWLQKQLQPNTDALPTSPFPARLQGDVAETCIRFAEQQLDSSLAEAMRQQQAEASAKTLENFTLRWHEASADNYWAHYIHAVALMALGKTNAAEKALLQARGLQSQYWAAALLLATLYERTNQTDKLVEVRVQLGDRRLDKPSALLDLARAYTLNKQDAEAYKIYQQLLDTNPHDPLLWQALARFYRERGMYGELKDLHLRLKKLQPVTAERIASLGLF